MFEVQSKTACWATNANVSGNRLHFKRCKRGWGHRHLKASNVLIAVCDRTLDSQLLVWHFAGWKCSMAKQNSMNSKNKLTDSFSRIGIISDLRKLSSSITYSPVLISWFIFDCHKGEPASVQSIQNPKPVPVTQSLACPLYHSQNTLDSKQKGRAHKLRIIIYWVGPVWLL